MTTVLLMGKILLCILCVFIIVVVAAQKPSDDNPGAAFGQGNSDSYINKVRTRTIEGKLNAMTRVGGLLVAVVTFVLVILQNTAS